MLLTFAGLAAKAEPVLIFAASSLQEPLDEALADRQDVTVSYGGSGTLARQILAGAPADLVILAHPDWMDTLAEAGRLATPPVSLLSNELVLIAPRGAVEVALTPEDFSVALGDGFLAVGLTTSVPAGLYAKAALQSLGLWEVAEPRLAETDSVRAVLALVARGEVPLGIVYATDARVTDAVDIVARFPEESHPPILYSAAVVSDGHEAAAAVVLQNLQAAADVFQEAGFQLVADR